MDFEQALARLEAIVRELEGGRLKLEDALALFGEGVELSRLCRRLLAEAETRVVMLSEGQSEGEK